MKLNWKFFMLSEYYSKMYLINSLKFVFALIRSGTYMATAGMDRSLKIWDLRNTYQCVGDYKLPGNTGAAHLQVP